MKFQSKSADEFWHCVRNRLPVPLLGTYDGQLLVVQSGTQYGLHDPRAKHINERFVDKNAVWAFKNIEHEIPSQYLDDVELYTRSNYTPEQLYKPLEQAIESQAVAISTVPSILENDPDFWFVVDEACDKFTPVRNLVPIDLDKVKTPENSFAGYGYTGTRGENRELGLRKARNLYQSFIDDGYDVEKSTPFIGLSRTQIAALDSPKVRLVWAAAQHSLLLSGRIFQPLYNVWKHYPTPTMFGRTVDEQVIIVYNAMASCTQIDSDLIALVGDFPAFDTGKIVNGTYHYGTQLWEDRIATSIMAQSYIESPSDRKHEIAALFTLDLIQNGIKRIAVHDRIYTVKGMRPSGEFGTYMKDSIINYVRLRYTQVKLFGRNCPLVLKVGGDDSFQTIPSCEDLVSKINVHLQPFNTQLAPPPKTQMSAVPGGIIFHGHSSPLGTISRDVPKVLQLAILTERSNLEENFADATISYQRLNSIYIDSGKRHHFLIHAANMIETRFPGVKDQPSTLRNEALAVVTTTL